MFKEGMMKAVVVQRVDQGADHMFLAQDVSELPWAPFPGEGLVTHDRRLAMEDR